MKEIKEPKREGQKEVLGKKESKRRQKNGSKERC